LLSKIFDGRSTLTIGRLFTGFRGLLDRHNVSKIFKIRYRLGRNGFTYSLQLQRYYRKRHRC